MPKNKFSNIDSIIKDAKKGKMFILVDDEKRENEGDLVISSSFANTKNINFMAKYGRGLICLAMEGSQAKKLNLSLMSPINQSRNKTAFAISIEAKKGITTGISAKDRAKTIKVASKKNASRKDIVSPGHVFPIIAKDGGVLVRAGHTEASVDISKLAKKNNSAVICEIMKDDGTMARGRDLVMFAKKHKLGIAKIEDLISYRLKKEKLVRLKKKLDIKIQDQNFKLKIFENKINDSEHLAFIKGNMKNNITPKVRVISSSILLENILVGGKLPDTFNKTMKYFKKENFFILDQSFPYILKTIKTGEKRCAIRLSEYESINTVLSLKDKLTWVWIDFFTKFPIDFENYKTLKKYNFKLCFVSPELQGHTHSTCLDLKNYIKSHKMYFDAVCTNKVNFWEEL